MEIVALVGRLLFCALFLGAAVGHFKDSKAMTEYAKAKKLPMPGPAVLGSGVVLVLGGLSVLLGVWADLGCLLLFLFLVGAAVTMHDFWRQTDPAGKQVEQAMFMKNIALAGASLMLFTVFVSGDLSPTLTGPLF